MLLLPGSEVRGKDFKPKNLGDEYSLGHLNRWAKSERGGFSNALLGCSTGYGRFSTTFRGWRLYGCLPEIQNPCEDPRTIEDLKTRFFLFQNIKLGKLQFTLVLKKHRTLKRRKNHFTGEAQYYSTNWDKYYLNAYYDGKQFFQCGPYNSNPSNYNWGIVLWYSIQRHLLFDLEQAYKHTKGLLATVEEEERLRKQEEESIEEFIKKSNQAKLDKQASKDNKDYQEYVYMVGNEDADVVKIGVATNIESRMKSIQTGCPYQLKVLYSETGNRKKEKKYHKRCDLFRLCGEWFKLSGVKQMIPSLRL